MDAKLLGEDWPAEEAAAKTGKSSRRGLEFELPDQDGPGPLKRDNAHIEQLKLKIEGTPR